jgi:hypothetical protein
VTHCLASRAAFTIALLGGALCFVVTVIVLVADAGSE